MGYKPEKINKPFVIYVCMRCAHASGKIGWSCEKCGGLTKRCVIGRADRNANRY